MTRWARKGGRRNREFEASEWPDMKPKSSLQVKEEAEASKDSVEPVAENRLVKARRNGQKTSVEGGKKRKPKLSHGSSSLKSDREEKLLRRKKLKLKRRRETEAEEKEKDVVQQTKAKKKKKQPQLDSAPDSGEAQLPCTSERITDEDFSGERNEAGDGGEESGGVELKTNGETSGKKLTKRKKKVHRESTGSVLQSSDRGISEQDNEQALAEKKWQRRERRRLRRQAERCAKQVCFSCRQPGHKMSECPNVEDTVASGICFKCGSTEHGAYSCRSKTKGFPFAKCFVCGEEGHLSRQCKQNLNGLYPNGGCCKQCGSINHFVKDCPAVTGKEEKEEFVVQRIAAAASVDAEADFVSPSNRGPVKKTKIIKF